MKTFIPLAILLAHLAAGFVLDEDEYSLGRYLDNAAPNAPSKQKSAQVARFVVGMGGTNIA